jgi:hypothetical protein
MILLLLAANILFSIPVVTPIFLLLVQTAGGTLAADRLLADKIDARWLIDLFNHQFPGASLESLGFQVVALLVVAGMSYLTFNAFLAGGIIETCAAGDGRFTMRKFWSGCGAYFWRFFRLLLISWVFYGTAFLVYLLARRPINHLADRATAYEPVVYQRWAATVMLMLVIAFVNMVFDYARISAVINDSRAMTQAAFQAFRFALRNFFRGFGLYLIIAIIGVTGYLLLAWLRSSINQSSVIAVFIAFLLGQTAIAVRMWARVACYAAELKLYQRLIPTPAQPRPIIAPPALADVEFQAATAAAGERPVDQREERTENISTAGPPAMSAPADTPPLTAKSVAAADETGKEKI